MSQSTCSSCLARLRLSTRPAWLRPAPAILFTSSFHTSIPRQQAVVKKKSGPAPVKKHREGASVKIKKRARVRPRPPAVGERKLARKRIVLSNTNALEVGMANLSVENMADAQNIGQVLGLEGSLLDQLREVKAFKTTQNWNMFRRPATLIREETVELGQDITEVNDCIAGQKTDEGLGAEALKQVITGERQSGKSLLLVQAMSMAFLNKWVVISVPEAQDWTINQSSYAPIQSESEEQHYVQPHLTSGLLSHMAYSNSSVLQSLNLSHDHSKSNIPVRKSMTLKDLTMIGVEDPQAAWPIWQAVWKELTEPVNGLNTKRPPVLISIDGLDHWMGITQYRTSDYGLIHAHQFVLINQLISLLFSTEPLKNGGMVLAATSASNSPSLPTFQLLLQQLAARAAGQQMTDSDFPMPAPYAKVDQRVLDLFHGSNGTLVRELKGLSRPEARGLLEYFARSGILKEKLTPELVGEKWSLAGGGLVGEMAKLGSRVRV